MTTPVSHKQTPGWGFSGRNEATRGDTAEVLGHNTLMPDALKWVIGLLGAILLAVTPYFWWINPTLLWVAIPLLCAWSAWLMLEYLRWARSLGKGPRS